jgi:hypothetical protein
MIDEKIKPIFPEHGSPWPTFEVDPNSKSQKHGLDIEKELYEMAHHIFDNEDDIFECTFSDSTKEETNDSLIEKLPDQPDVEADQDLVYFLKNFRYGLGLPK